MMEKLEVINVDELRKKQNDCKKCRFSDNGENCGMKKCWWSMKYRECLETMGVVL
jgi:hypothetical protein